MWDVGDVERCGMIQSLLLHIWLMEPSLSRTLGSFTIPMDSWQQQAHGLSA